MEMMTKMGFKEFIHFLYIIMHMTKLYDNRGDEEVNRTRIQ